LLRDKEVVGVFVRFWCRFNVETIHLKKLSGQDIGKATGYIRRTVILVAIVFSGGRIGCLSSNEAYQNQTHPKLADAGCKDGRPSANSRNSSQPSLSERSPAALPAVRFPSWLVFSGTIIAKVEPSEVPPR
jgi:hypothetical protein